MTENVQMAPESGTSVGKDGLIAGVTRVRSLVLRGWRALKRALTPEDDRGGEPVRRWQLAAHGGLLAAAAALRLWDLGSRAMHHDESLHAYYSYNLSSGVGYEHHPMMHGPFQMEATAGLFFALGDSDYTARLLYALAGIVLVALPFLFRARLGNLGAVFVSAMLAFSPVMLYFSRFARNDILMAVWSLGLIIAMWRYLDEGKNRYLYVGAGLLGLAFATKETSYILVFTLGLYLGLLVTFRNWAAIRQGVVIGEVSPPVALMRVVVGAAATARRGLSLSGLSRPAGFLVLLFTLSLPMGAALASVFQDTSLMSWSNLVLAQPAEPGNDIGAPLRGGLVIAFLVVVGLITVSAVLGSRWSGRVWWISAAIFFGVIVLLYSTFFTHIAGIGSGMWRSLGYWLAQQEVARGGQPWYYYLVITPVYEFLPLLIAIPGAIFYLRRRDSFGAFLVFWAIASFVLYTLASEKMPWLLVNVALPLIVLAGKFLAEVVEGIQWCRLGYVRAAAILVGAPVFLLLSWRLAFFGLDGMSWSEAILAAAGLSMMAALGAMASLYARKNGLRNLASVAAIPIVAILLVLTIRTGLLASFRNGDTPVEMLVYTQTSPDIVTTLRSVEQAALDSGTQTDIPIALDQTSGFTWPWAWYLRGYSRLSYSAFDSEPIQVVPGASVILIHEKNRSPSADLLSEHYGDGQRIKHRWWFPENYRGLTLGKFLSAVVDRKAWRTQMDYFLYRKLSQPLGSEDAYVYISTSN